MDDTVRDMRSLRYMLLAFAVFLGGSILLEGWPPFPWLRDGEGQPFLNFRFGQSVTQPLQDLKQGDPDDCG